MATTSHKFPPPPLRISHRETVHLSISRFATPWGECYFDYHGELRREFFSYLCVNKAGMHTPPTLIVIPTFNERENIGLLIPEIKRFLPHAHVLVVDDGSPDGTSAVVKEVGRRVKGVHVLDRARKEGLGRAYIAGFRWALEREYELIFEMDADFSHSPEYLPDFMKAIERNDLVIGSRYKNGVNVINWPMGRLLLSWCANRIVTRLITGLPLTDSTGGYKCFRRRVLESIRLDHIDSSGYSFQIEMNYLAWHKSFRIEEIPIVFKDRQRGVSKMSTKIVREALILLWKLRLSSFLKRGL